MVNVLKNLLGFLRLGDEDDYDDYVDDYEEMEPITTVPKKTKREQAATLEQPSRNAREAFKKEEAPASVTPKKEKTFLSERTNKVVPIRTTSKGLEVCILKPTTFEDSQDVCDMLLSERAAIINLEGFDAEDAQRIMDFVSGCVYAINGKLHQISRYIFIISPENIDISGDYLDIAKDAAFGVPTLNREF